MNATTRAWIAAARPRTLPLALSSIGLGAFLAAGAGQFRWEVLFFSALTTIFLQVLSNLANDYGDSVHGADSVNREGPNRAVQSGVIDASAMKTAVITFSLLSLFSGIGLLYAAFGGLSVTFWIFIGLGLLAIGAAITYTAGNKPYGYMGLGDLSVLLFFGLLGVGGSFYLHAGFIDASYLLPALTCGLFSVAVLNVNNIRDMKTDKEAGKISIPVRLGRKRAVRYHWILLATGLLASVLYVLLNYESAWQWLFLVSVPLIFRNGKAVQVKTQAKELDPYLKQMALSTLVYVLTFGLGNLLG